MKTFSILLIILTSLNVLAAKIGPLDVDSAFCEDADSVGTVTSAFQSANFPVAGSPGIAVGVVNSTNQVLEYCKYMNDLAALQSARSTDQQVNQLNKITDSRWEEELTFANNTYDTANSSNSFTRNGNRKGALNGAKVARSLKRFNKDYVGVYNKNTPADSNDMAEIAKAAQRRAVLAEMVKCPKPTDASADYDKVYKDEIAPLEKNVDDYEENTKFYQGRLLSMGDMFVPIDMVNTYEIELKALVSRTYAYSLSEKTVTDDTVRKTGKLDANGKATVEKGKISKTVQIVTVEENSQAKRAFQEKWEPYWRSYVDARYKKVNSINDSSSFGREKSATLLGLQNDLKRTIFDCPPVDIQADVDKSYKDSKILKEPLSEQAFEADFNKCVAKTRVEQGSAEDAFNRFVRRYMANAQQYRENQAKYWTKQSELLGINISIAEDASDGMQSEEVACSDRLTMADMSQAQLEYSAVNTKLAESTATDTKKLLQMKKAEKDADAAVIVELQRKDRAAQSSRDEETDEILKSTTRVGR